MAQILVPTSDLSTGSWSSTPLWSKVDDDSTVNPSGDGTVITSDDNTSPDNADLDLATGTDPAVSTGHILRALWNKDATGGHVIDAVLELWQGTPGTGTLIATLSVADIGASEVESTYTLTGTEADSITDYSALNLRVSRQGDTGGNPNGRRSLVVDLVELEVPDATVSDAQGQVSWAELEVPSPPRGAQLSWAELEVPDAPSFVVEQTASNTNSADLGDLTVAIATPAAGNLLVAYLFHRPSGEPTFCQDQNGDNFTEMLSVEDSTNGDWYKAYYKVAEGDETSVTFDVVGGGSSDFQVGIVLEVSGFSSTPTLDKTAVNGPVDGTTASSGTTDTLTQQPVFAAAGWSFRSTGSATSTADSYTNGFAEALEDSAGDTAAQKSYLTAATKNVGSTDPVESTVTISDSGRLMGGVAIFREGSNNRQGQLSWAELEVPTPPRGAQLSWAELEVPIAPRQSQVSWAELEVPTAPRVGQVSWAELEVPLAPREAQVSWSELETPDGPRQAQVSWSEFEAPTAPREVQVSWAEVEVNDAPRQGQVSWSELEVPDVPTNDKQGQVSWAELEAPDAPRGGQVSWAEMEAPTPPRQGQVSWAEMEVPTAPRGAAVSWSELEVPTAPRAGLVSWAEMEAPPANASAQISWAELEVPEVGGPSVNKFLLLGVDVS